MSLRRSPYAEVDRESLGAERDDALVPDRRREHGEQADFATPQLTHVFKSIGITNLDAFVPEVFKLGHRCHVVSQLQLDGWLKQLGQRGL
jgi:hypothetical protein